MNKECKMANKSYRPINRDCTNCKHKKCHVEKEPCNGCNPDTFSNWVQAKPKDKDK